MRLGIIPKITDSSNFGNVPFGVDPTDRRKPTLIIHEIIFEELQPMWS